MADFYRGTSISFEISNRPWVDKSVPINANDYRNADFATIIMYDPCGNLFIDCPLYPCPDKIGWYLFQIQTDEHFPIGLYKVIVKLQNTIPGLYGLCTSTSGTSGTSTSGTSGSPVTNVATSEVVKTFRLMESVTV